MNVIQYAWLVPIFPLIGFLINGLLRNKLSKSMIGTIGSGSVLLSFIVSILLFLQVKDGNTGVINYFDFISVGKLHIPFALIRVKWFWSFFLIKEEMKQYP